MKNNRLALIVTLFLVVVAIFFIWNKNASSTLHADADFAVTDTASVTKIFIADMNANEVLLERSSDGWILNKNFKAQQRKISDLLYTMMKLRVRTPVAQASQDNVIKRMAGMAVKVEVYQVLPRINLFNRIKFFPREIRSVVYYVGDTPKDNLGTFMLKEGAETAYIMQITGFKGFLSSRYSPLADEWRDHKVFSTNLNDIQSVKVEFNQEPEKSYVITRVGKHAYKLENLQGQTFNQNIDTLRMLNFLSSFADIRFEALLNSLPETRKDSVTNSPFLHQITLTNTQGEQNVVTTFTKKKFGQYIVNEDRLAPLDLDRMYARVNQGKDFVLIQYFVFDKVLRPVNYFIPGSPDYDSF